MCRVIYIVSACIVSTAPVWSPYLRGLGGHERLVTNGMLFVFVIFVATVVLFIASLFRFVSARLHHRPFLGVARLLFTFIVICSVFGLPHFFCCEVKKIRSFA